MYIHEACTRHLHHSNKGHQVHDSVITMGWYSIFSSGYVSYSITDKAGTCVVRKCDTRWAWTLVAICGVPLPMWSLLMLIPIQYFAHVATVPRFQSWKKEQRGMWPWIQSVVFQCFPGAGLSLLSGCWNPIVVSLGNFLSVVCCWGIQVIGSWPTHFHWGSSYIGLSGLCTCATMPCQLPNCFLVNTHQKQAIANMTRKHKFV